MNNADKLIKQLDNAQGDHRKAVSALETQLDAIRGELRTTTENLAKREARLSQIINTANDAFLSTDIAGTINEWNSTAETLFGWTQAEMIGKPISSIVRPDESFEQTHGQACLTAILGVLGEQQRGEIIGIHRDGNRFPVEVSISVMVDEESFIFNAFIHDISAKAAMQRQLSQAQKLESIGQLAAGIAHEINTPTQYIGDNLEFLQDTFNNLITLVNQQQALLDAAKAGPVPAQVLRQTEDVTRNADLAFVLEETPGALAAARDGVTRISNIVNAMKEFAHPGVENMTSIDLNRAIMSTATVCQSEWRYVADLVTELDPDLPPVPCLPGELNQVFLNIIVNAAQAIDGVKSTSGNKGLIKIKTHALDDHVLVEITDNGPGIPEEIRTRVFDPFFTTKEVGKGSGQGLSIAHSVVVDKHGGALTVTSEPGKGTTFQIKLPLLGADEDEVKP
ncbi:MAG: ATP-binding protein [Phycisphaerales bacterium]